MDVKIDVPEKAPFEAWLAGAVMVALMTLVTIVHQLLLKRSYHVSR